LISFDFLWFGAGWILWFSFDFLWFVWFPREKQRKAHPRKRHTNQGKFKEAISSQNASIMPVTKTFLRYVYIYNYIPSGKKQKHIISTNHPKRLKNHTYLIPFDTLWLFNMAMENKHELPMKNGDCPVHCDN
jgi:hypothetical protein